MVYQLVICKQPPLSMSFLADKYNISVTAITTRIYRLKRKIRALSHQYWLTRIENVQCEAQKQGLSKGSSAFFVIVYFS
nr:HTH domain-containing protein [Paenibacillus polymyxa]